MNEIVGKKYYNKVDFTDPVSIFCYGQDLLEEMGSFMNDISVMKDLDESSDFNVEEKLRKINNFAEYLDKDKPSKKIEKKLPIPVFIKSYIDEAKEKIFGTESYSTTFSEAYEEINSDLDAIGDHINFKAKRAMKRIEISKAFVSKMEEYIVILEDLIQRGEEDLEDYTMNSEDSDLLSKRAITLFREKLQSLTKNLQTFKNSILQTKLKIHDDYGLLDQYQSYKTSDLSLLRNQATDMITTKQQRDDLEEQKQLNDITNNALINNAKTIRDNTKRVMELKENGTIQVSTLKEIVNYSKEGLRIIQQGQSQEQLNAEREAKMIDSISSEIDEISNEIKILAEAKNNALVMKNEG